MPGPREPAWLEDGTPYSPEHGDVYYTRGEGVDEARHVFLDGNALASRWAALPDDPALPFVIAETGFGTGLNFLAAWQLWNRQAPPRARLVFRSVELHPLSRGAMARALGTWVELAAWSARLLAQWPPAVAGLHVLDFDGGRVQLQLFTGEAAEALDEFLDASGGPVVDAWFLDGFSPARNPAMWRVEVLRRVAALTRPDGTLATFTAASAVRSGLAEAGFEVRKAPGYGRKRDMTVARRTAMPAPRGAPAQTPWHRGARPAPLRSALVVGAGIAGSATALALARRGWRVQVLEAAPTPAAGASGNPQGILFTQLPAGDSAHGEFTLASYLHACRWHASLFDGAPGEIGRCGLLQLVEPGQEAAHAKLARRYAALGALVRFVDRDEASALARVEVSAGGLFLPASGWVDPRRACERALDQPGISLHTGIAVHALRHGAQGWVAECAGGQAFEAGAVVLANALGALSLLPAGVTALEPVRGQLTLLPESALPGTPRCVVCADGYLVPPREGVACCGASFLRGQRAGEPTTAEDTANLARLAALLPGFRPETATLLGARVAERCASPDRLPLAGCVPAPAAFRDAFAPLRGNARRVIDRPGEYLDGLALNVAHGSRGLCSAPLCAELVAAELSGEARPVTRRVARALSPARFLVRAIVRGKPA